MLAQPLSAIAIVAFPSDTLPIEVRERDRR
jgi:hypothetical protein